MGKQFIFAIVGILATLVAILGVFLPGIPTTFPVIIALWAFSRSSKRLGRGLERIPLLRVALLEAKRYEVERTVALRAKIVSQSCAWGSTILLGVLTQNVIITAVADSVTNTCSIQTIEKYLEIVGTILNYWRYKHESIGDERKKSARALV